MEYAVPISAPAYTGSVDLGVMTGLMTLIPSIVMLLAVFGGAFFIGLMFYYFAGQKRGEHIVANMMNFLTRLYAQFWMYVSVVIGLIGLGQIVRSIIGFLFPIFTYGTKSANTVASNDLRSGLLVFGVAVVVFAIHYFLSNVVESARQKRGTALSKGFVGLGLFTTSTVLIVSLFSFVFQLAAFTTTSLASTSTPGATMATLLATLPFWVYYVARASYMMRFEK